MVVSARRVLLISALALTTSVAHAGDGGGRRVRLGGISVSAGYMSGPAWWGPSYWGPWGGYYPAAWGPGLWRPWGPAWWSPMWFNGWAHPGYWSGFAQGPGMGEVKLAKIADDAMLFLDGAYAGPVNKLRTMWLEPGKYDIEVRDDSGRLWGRHIYVLSGKTLDLRPHLKEALGK